MEQRILAEQVISFLQRQPAVCSVTVIGSLKNGTADALSDIDLEVDVSGSDNGVFALELPALLSTRFDVLFYDYAPSLAPEKYVVTVAIDREKPFHLLDVGFTATPHGTSVSKEQLEMRNDRYVHLLKLFVANLKHHLRGLDCRKDIEKMYGKVFGADLSVSEEDMMLRAVYNWLKENASSRFASYVNTFSTYL